MKLKSYLRGIGAGMIVAALVMGISIPKTSKEIPINNETLIESSKNDNNIEVTVSKDETQTVEASVSSTEVITSVSEDVQEPEKNVVSEPETEPGKEPETETNVTSIPEAETPVVSVEEEEAEVFTLKIISGDDSVSVSRRLFEAGLIDSVGTFDDFLCANRYDRFLCVGTYEIKYGADYEKIAKIITKRDYNE